MNTITISRKKYKQLKQQSAAYIKIVKEITKAEQEYPYDSSFLDRVDREALKGKWTEAKSVDAALAKSRKR